MPVSGAVAEKVAVAIHSVWFPLTAAGEGGISRCTVRVDVDGGHTPLRIVHKKLFAPGDNPVTVAAGLFEFVIDAPPVSTFHCPVPTTGAFAEKVKVVEQTVAEVPAEAIEGSASRIMVMLAEPGVQTPFETVHTKTLLPVLSPLATTSVEDGKLRVAAPEATLH